ncbi:MAG: zf-HC2 domain-containing protein [Steroidobacteraceae bacterium]
MNTEHLPPCAEFEHEIVELGEGLLADDDARAVRAHLDGCPRCRGWLESWTSIDSALAAALPPEATSPGFTAALMARIATETRRAPAPERRGAAEREYETASRALRAAYRRNAIALAVVAALALVGLGLALPWIGGATQALARAVGPAQLAWAELGVVVAIVAGTLGWASTRDAMPLPRFLR